MPKSVIFLLKIIYPPISLQKYSYERQIVGIWSKYSITDLLVIFLQKKTSLTELNMFL